MNHEKSSRWLKGFTALFSFGVVIFDYLVLFYNNGHVGMYIKTRQNILGSDSMMQYNNFQAQGQGQGQVLVNS